ncbi:putative cytochrome b5-like heme/steroid binding domain, cytochrome b5, heme-binding protein [Helianthus debilis subsp. tardiflorus]
MASDQKTFVFDEVAKHNKADDCWLIISGKVYDVTLFMDNHPGGGEVWLRATGKDATVDFSDVDHSDIAKGKMEKYYIGEIDQSTIPVKHSNSKHTLIIKVLLVGIMVAALGILFAVL